MHSEELLKWVNAILHNDEASTDKELIEHFTKNGLTQQEAQKVVSQRNQCLNDNSYEVEL